MSKKLSFSLVSLVVCLAGETMAQAAPPVNVQSLTSNQIASLQEFKLQPRFNLWGYSGSSTLTEGQFLAPLYGDQSKTLYVMAEGNYVKNDSTWLGGAGLGYRQVVGERIYGGYVTGDVISTELRSKFVIANPGLELLGPVWDFNINGYIPVTNKRKVGKEGWAGDDFGIYKYARATGHDYYDHRLQQYEEPGRGLDFEVARVIPHIEDAKLHLGAYHFDTPEMGSVNGVESRLSYDLNKYTSLEVENDYDNVSHNKVLFGIRFTLGGYSKEEKQQFGVATRLLDPIDHDNIILQSSSLIPIVTSPGTDLGERKEHDNVWYFKAGSSSSSTSSQFNGPTADAQSGSGTAENPFIGFTPANYAAINPNEGEINKYPLMFFAPGSYSLGNFIGSTGISNRFALPNGWGMYGRNANYTRPADGDYPAKFSGGVDLNYIPGNGTAVTTLDSISITNSVGGENNADALANAALYAAYADDVSLRNASIENSATGNSFQFYVCGIYASYSTINFNSGSNAVTGTSTATDMVSNVSGIGYGIAVSFSTINFNGGSNSVLGAGSGAELGMGSKASGNGYGIYGYSSSGDSSTINFNDGTNTVKGMATVTSSNDASGNGYGIYDYASPYTPSTINFNDGSNTVSGTATVTGSNSVSGSGYGIYAYYSSINFSRGSNSILGMGARSGLNGEVSGASYGIMAPWSTVNFLAGINTVSGKDEASGTGSKVSSSGYGIYANNKSINFLGGSNAVSGTAVTLGSSGSPTGKGYGIWASATEINFNRGSNVVFGTTTVPGSGRNGSYGIYATAQSKVDFSGGSGEISGTTDGIYNDGGSSTIEWNDGEYNIQGLSS